MSDNNQTGNDLQILRRKQQADLLGVSVVTLWRLRDELPPEIQISKGIKGRRQSDLAVWLEQRSTVR